jgi:hypothetical protein
MQSITTFIVSGFGAVWVGGGLESDENEMYIEKEKKVSYKETKRLLRINLT